MNSTEYLCDYGDFINGLTKQLLCYNASTKKWTNPECFGDAPKPQYGHSTAIIKNKIWLHGGVSSSYDVLQEIFELDMLSYTWTRIQTGQTKPQGRFFASLTKISEKQLILHAGSSLLEYFCDTWIMDLSSYTWRKHSSDIYHSRSRQKGCSSINKGVVIFGGHKDRQKKSYTVSFHAMLEPKRLQQQAMKTLYLHRDELPWKCLPPSLIAQLGLSVNY